ncbi:MAG: hypothetical protein JSV12_04080 [Candidatus Bathyarchaeota archaeon]|nr:MAG: hypothetical protein JSV12_04080 [Candidatus Bathyarchaeota archaeon]
MPLLSRVQRLLIASGGLVLFIGFTMLGLAILGAFNVVEIEILLQRFRLLVGASAAVGVLDVIIGLLLLFPYKGRISEKHRKKPLRIVAGRFFLGYLEIGIGFALMLTALFVYFNIIDMQALTTLPSDYFPLFTFVLLMLGFVFAASGLFLVDKARRGV